MMDDATLLRRYTEDRAEDAFTELVQRHLGLVYAAALRQTEGDRHLAEEVAQQVFTSLARKAARLTDHPTLVGWLYRSTRYAALDARRARRRRQARFQEVENMHELPAPTDERVDWDQLRPILDQALCDLREADRLAVLWRYFEGRSFAEIGARLRLNENTARMRVDRALDKLRALLARRGLSSSAAALGAVLAGQSVVAAPAGLAGTIASTALASAATTAGAFAFLSLTTMTKFHTALVGALVAAGLTATAGALLTQPTRQQLAQLRVENANLQRALRDNPKAAAAYATGQFTALAERVQQRHTRETAKAAPVADSAVVAQIYRDRGNATPDAALETFTGACYGADSEAIGKLLYFDGNGRKLAEAVLARMPEAVRAQYPTPEALYGFFTAADCLVAPPPSDPSVLKKAVITYLRADRVVFRRPGATSGGHEFQLTPDGWKMAYPEVAIEALADQVMRTNPLAQ